MLAMASSQRVAPVSLCYKLATASCDSPGMWKTDIFLKILQSKWSKTCFNLKNHINIELNIKMASTNTISKYDM